METGPITLCIDVGGTSIKVLRCEADGQAIDPPLIESTPSPSTPSRVLTQIADAARRVGSFDRAGFGFPAVVRGGICTRAVNLDTGWQGLDLARELGDLLGVPVRAANDADVQGLGCVSGNGLELVLTLGTGIGSAMFLDGTLIPNLELGHLPWCLPGTDKTSFEQELGDAALKRIGVDAWLDLVPTALALYQRCLSCDTIYVGGGNARHLASLSLPDNVILIRNDAGLTGGVALWEGIPANRVIPRLT